VPLGEEIPIERGHQRGVPPLRNRNFTIIGSSSVKTVADRHRLAAHHNKHCWWAFRGYQHRWPWTTLNFKNMGFSELFAIWAVRHTYREFSLKLLEIYNKTICVRNYLLMLSRVSWALAHISCYFPTCVQ